MVATRFPCSIFSSNISRYLRIGLLFVAQRYRVKGVGNMLFIGNWLFFTIFSLLLFKYSAAWSLFLAHLFLFLNPCSVYIHAFCTTTYAPLSPTCLIHSQSLILCSCLILAFRLTPPHPTSSHSLVPFQQTHRQPQSR